MKNLKSLITNCCLIAIGALIYGFLALPMFSLTYSFSTYVSSTTTSSTGYDVIKNLFEGGSSNFAGSLMAISIFIISILAGLMILVAIFNLLTGTGVLKLKNKKVVKAMRITNFVLSALLAIFAIVAISCTASYLANGAGSTIAEGIQETLASIGVNLEMDTILSALGLTTNIGAGNILVLALSVISVLPATCELLGNKK